MTTLVLSLIPNPTPVCCSNRKPTEVEWRFTEEGEMVRVALRTGRIVPKPVFQRRDGIVPQQWKGESAFGEGGTEARGGAKKSRWIEVERELL